MVFGIISKTHYATANGKLIKKVSPINIKLEPPFEQAIGLGVCEKSSQILELINMYNQYNKNR